LPAVTVEEIAMVSKTLSNQGSEGFTIMELIIVLAIGVLVLYTIFTYVDPTRARARARDSVRLSDISMIEHAVNEYFIDNRSYPDIPNVIRKSHNLPSGSTQLMAASGGWIAVDMTSYIPRLPIDPLNDTSYYYAYKRNQNGYEITARLEYETELMTSDNGNESQAYEVGNDLSIIVAGE
jgi:type II secretory pathway pseudopilin PulG